MPELLEVETYRQAAEQALGRRIVEVGTPDTWFLKRNLTGPVVVDALVGAAFTAARRRGKLLLLDLDRGPVLGLRFGMTGRIVIDGVAPIDRLEYSTGRDDPIWDRFWVGFADGGSLRIRDPRRLGGVELDPSPDELGPDAAEITERQLATALAGSQVALKARLVDQRRVAGLGNLLVDEILWRAGLAPIRPASTIGPPELKRLHQHIRTTLRELAARGGSHTGDLQIAREPGSRCPRDGTVLRREPVGGRTTVWCPTHQG